MATDAPPPHLVVSTVEHAPYVMREDPRNPDEYSGFVKELLDAIADKAKFTYNFNLTKDHTFGSQTINGWSGVIGDVVKKNADIGAGAITVTPARESVVDFSKPFMTDSVNLLVYKPTWFDLGLSYLTRPFSSDYWAVVIIAFLLVGLMFWLIGKFSPYEWGNIAADRDPRGAKNAFSLRNSYLFAISTLTWQGFREPPRSWSGRLLAAIWWIFVLFTLLAYTANLTAFMLARKEMLPDMKFKTYEDLVSATDISTGVLQGGSTHMALRDSRSSTLRNLYTLMDKRHTYEDSYKEGALHVKGAEGSFVMMMEASSGLYYAGQHCELMVYGEDLFPTSMAFPMPQGSVWRVKFNDAIAELKADGIVDQLKDKYWRFGKCGMADGREMYSKSGFMSKLPVYAITLKDMGMAMIILFLGIFFSIISLIVEIIHYNVTKKGKKLHRPAIVKNPPKPNFNKIFKGKKDSKPAAPPADIEAVDETAEPVLSAGPSSDDDALESVPLEDSPMEQQEEQAPEESDPLVSQEPAEEKDLLEEQKASQA